jgi:hypothetical protein
MAMVSPIKSAANPIRPTNISAAPTPAVSAPRAMGVAMLKQSEAVRAITHPNQIRWGAALPVVVLAVTVLKRRFLILVSLILAGDCHLRRVGSEG